MKIVREKMRGLLAVPGGTACKEQALQKELEGKQTKEMLEENVSGLKICHKVSNSKDKL